MSEEFDLGVGDAEALNATAEWAGRIQTSQSEIDLMRQANAEAESNAAVEDALQSIEEPLVE